MIQKQSKRLIANIKQSGELTNKDKPKCQEITTTPILVGKTLLCYGIGLLWFIICYTKCYKSL